MTLCHSGQNRPRPAIHFQWDLLPRIDPAWVTLICSIRDVRAAAGQEGVDKFIKEWRTRGYIECSDEDAERLRTVDLPRKAVGRTNQRR